MASMQVQTVLDVPCGDVNWQFESWEVDSLPHGTRWYISTHNDIMLTNHIDSKSKLRTGMNLTENNVEIWWGLSY